MSSGLPKKVTNVVWGQFNGRCAMCERLLAKTLEDGASSATIGKIAHIVGENKGSARYNEDLTLPQKNNPDNLMLLCGTHHDMVDNYESEYSIEQLHDIKNKFTRKLSSIFQEQVLAIGFAELEVTIAYLVKNRPEQLEGSLENITPYEKIHKNALSPEIEELLRMGLTREKQLEDYLNKNLDPTFAARLRNIFVEKYNQLKEERLNPDEIFYEIHSFASGSQTDFVRQAAGLTIVAYYFYICDIFER